MRGTHTCCSRFAEIQKTALPVGLSLFLEQLIDLASLYFSAQLGPGYLAATGLAIALSNILGLAPLYGLSSALDSLGASAFQANNFLLAGHYFNQARIIVFMTTLVLPLPLFMLAGPML